MSQTLTELVRQTKPFATEDRKKSWQLLASTLLLIGLWIILILASPSAILKAPLAIVLGLTLVRLFIIYHDFQHGAILQKSPAAKWILNSAGLLLLNPPNVWNRSHNYHHKFNSQISTASIGSFPILTVKDYQSATFLQKFLYQVARHWFTIASGYVTIFILGMCLKSFLTDPRRHWDSLLALLIHAALIIGVTALAGPSGLVFLVLLPFLTCCAAGAYLFYIQHNFPDMKLKNRAEWDFGFAALRSSSYLECSPLMHWFTGNIGYHHVHHLNSRIPFYRLPEAMAAVPSLQDPGRTHLSFREIRRCLALKVWDPTSDRMLSWAELRAKGASLPTSESSEGSAPLNHPNNGLAS
jgi:omega-6 fatty acid desaturase (delta-12 desaturase)